MSAHIVKNSDLYRKDIRARICEILTGAPTVEVLGVACGTDEETQKIATNIEKSVYNYAIKESTARKVVKKWENPYFVQLYVDRLRSIYTNLRTNVEFRERIVSGEIAPATLSSMSHMEMAPEQWTELIQNKIKKESNKYNVDDGVYSDMFQCRKCKSRKVKYFEMQTRSADEPCTVFCSCINGHNWRIN